jgi:hypothetical protein
MDNAPYHHVREIESLAGKRKDQIVALMKEYEVSYIHLPLTDERKGFLPEGHQYTIENDQLRLPFDEQGCLRRKVPKNPSCLTTPSVDELRVAFVMWLKDNKPDVLRCKVEKFIEDEGGTVLWTPPYCPDLQPIELFWAAGKNNVALNYYHGRSVKETVKDLRDGWYGNLYRNRSGVMEPRTPEGEDPDIVEEIDASDCGGLVRHSIKCANERIKAIPGISGTVEKCIIVDPEYKRVEVTADAIPIDTLVNTALEGVNEQAAEVEVDEADLVDLTDAIEEFEVGDLGGDFDVDVEDVFSDDDDE